MLHFLLRAVYACFAVPALVVMTSVGSQAQSDDLTDLSRQVAQFYQAGKYAEAVVLARRALALAEKKFDRDHPDVAMSFNNLAELYFAQGRYGSAEPLMKRSLIIFEKTLGSDHPTVAAALNNLAELYVAQGRYAKAEPLHKRSLAILEKALGPGHPDVGQSLNDFALFYFRQGRYAEAEPLHKRSLAIREKALGPGHPDVGESLNNLAWLYFLKRDWVRAAMFWRRSTDVLVRRARRGTRAVGKALTGKRKSETARSSWQFRGLVKATYRLAASDRSKEVSIQREMFLTAQWASSSDAAAALARMSARGAKGDPNLAGIVRERQDLVAEWQKRDQTRSATVAQAPDKRNSKAEAANVARIAAIDARIADIDKRLTKDFPDYAALSNPQPLSVEDVQAHLALDEALILILDTPAWKPAPDETFIWVVTKTGSRWVRSGLGSKGLKREVAALRCGLDVSNWTNPTAKDDDTADVRRQKGAQKARRIACIRLTGRSAIDRDLPPFDAARAHALYKGLFGKIDGLIRDKRLLIVPSGALTALPFQVLVTKPPTEAVPAEPAGYAKVSWLGQRNALTVLPTVASLMALRAYAKASKAAEKFIGFGNPLLTGRLGRDKSAWEKQSCPPPWFAARVRTVVLALSQQIASFFRAGLANVEEVRRQSPLPETADELCAVARALGIDPPDPAVYLGARATEAQVKQLSVSGKLARSRIVHFATHGLIAGETARLAKARAEPSLILTPPAKASEADDGLLTASEVTTLKFDADLVILSACNTAAGGTIGGDAFSGLARAFFYAGARALLVSHWYVNSQATVALITNAFKELKDNPQIGRAEAMRRAMSALITAGGRSAHPANWAPFVVVGEGGAGR